MSPSKKSINPLIISVEAPKFKWDKYDKIKAAFAVDMTRRAMAEIALFNNPIGRQWEPYVGAKVRFQLVCGEVLACDYEALQCIVVDKRKNTTYVAVPFQDMKPLPLTQEFRLTVVWPLKSCLYLDDEGRPRLWSELFQANDAVSVDASGFCANYGTVNEWQYLSLCQMVDDCDQNDEKYASCILDFICSGACNGLSY